LAIKIPIKIPDSKIELLRHLCIFDCHFIADSIRTTFTVPRGNQGAMFYRIDVE
jgi:hypothetical protein